jgi:hypothetical protein
MTASSQMTVQTVTVQTSGKFKNNDARGSEVVERGSVILKTPRQRHIRKELPTLHKGRLKMLKMYQMPSWLAEELEIIRISKSRGRAEVLYGRCRL